MMENSPYQTPSTPSDQMAHSPKVQQKLSSAYRDESVFYCEPDFASPNICFKTGVPVPVYSEKSKLWSKSTTVELYFDKQYLKELGRKQRLKILLVMLLMVVSFVFVMVFASFLFFVPMIGIVVVALRPAKEKSIQIEALPNGFYAIQGAHPHFLALFPEKTSRSEIHLEEIQS